MARNGTSRIRIVVLDGSNIVAQGTEKGNNGFILLSAIEYYQNLGYRVIVVMKGGTIRWMRYNEEPGHEIITQMEYSGQLISIEEGDDETVIQIAQKKNGWIITYDTFSYDKEKDGKTIPSERKANPDWDWDDIDRRTRGTEWNGGERPKSGQHWLVVDLDFFDPTMPKAPHDIISSDYAIFREDLQTAIGKMNRVAGFLSSNESKLKKRMMRDVTQIAKIMSGLMEMIPPPVLPDEDKVNNFLLDDCKELIGHINQFDEEAKLKVSGKRDELRSRINAYARKTRAKLAREDVEENARLESLQKERRSAEEAGMSVSKFRKFLRNKDRAKAN